MRGRTGGSAGRKEMKARPRSHTTPPAIGCPHSGRHAQGLHSQTNPLRPCGDCNLHQDCYDHATQATLTSPCTTDDARPPPKVRYKGAREFRCDSASPKQMRGGEYFRSRGYDKPRVHEISLHKLLSDRQQLPSALGVHFWIIHFESLERVEDDLGHDQPRGLLVVSGNDVPWGIARARCT
jgi:hypothetical protein